MGRTFRGHRDFEEESYSSRNKKNSKHSRNIPGRGMRIVNEFNELVDDSDEYLDDEYYVNTSQYDDKRRNKNGY